MNTRVSRLGRAACLRSVTASLLTFAWVVPGLSQPPSDATPDSVATEFQSALRAMAWRAAAQRMHPEGLGRFRERVDMLVDVNPETLLTQVFAGMSGEDYRALSEEEVFVRTMHATMSQMRGLLHAVVVRDVDVIGAVLETSDVAHVVYRSQAHLSGATPEMRVMTLKRAPQGWRVVDSPELDVIREALRGFNRGSVPPS